MTDQPIINIIGEKVALGPYHRDLLPHFVRWVNDFEVTMPYMLELRPHPHEEREKSFNSFLEYDPTTVAFAIYERATLRPIGYTMLDSIERTTHCAEFSIFIGEKECWGQGYGTETTTLMLDYGFTLLRLHNIMLRVDSYNERAIRAYLRAGFKEFGRRREVRPRGQRRYDVIYMDCLTSEFQSRLLGKLLPA